MTQQTRYTVSIFDRNSQTEGDVNSWYKTEAGAMRRLWKIDREWGNGSDWLGYSVRVWKHSRDSNNCWSIEMVRSVPIS